MLNDGWRSKRFRAAFKLTDQGTDRVFIGLSVDVSEEHEANWFAPVCDGCVCVCGCGYSYMLCIHR